MAREVTLIILGVLVALSPYLGLPVRALAVLLPVLGLIIAVLGLIARTRLVQSRSVVPPPSYDPSEA